jgi:malonate transporter MadL subunit
MTISGVALLAICTLIGVFLGDLLGIALGVKANVGGVGIAMIRLMSHGLKLGVEFWGALYIPIVVAMAAQQNVVAAAEGGPVVVIAAVGALLLCFGAVAVLSRLGGTGETMDEIEARSAVAREAARLAAGESA